MAACPPAEFRRAAGAARGGEPDADLSALTGRHLEHVVSRDLGAGPLGIDGILGAADDEVVDPVLDVRGGIRRPEQSLAVRLVLAEQQRSRRVGRQHPLAELVMVDTDGAVVDRGHCGLRDIVAPRPRVAEPQRGEEVEGRGGGSPVVGSDQHEDVVRGLLRVFHDDVEVPIVVEHPGVEQLVLHVLFAAPGVRREQIRVRERALGILVLALEVGMGRGAVDVEPVLLDVLAVVALAVREPEHPLLDDRVGTVPERKRKAQALAFVADPCDPILAPPVGARSGVVVGEVVPGVTVVAVVLADGAPLSL